MAHSENFALNVSEIDSDYENTEGGEPGQAPFQFIDEPATNSNMCPEIIEMDVLEECKGLEEIPSHECASLQRHRWSTATVKMLSLMPSHTAGISSDAVMWRARHSSKQNRHHKSSHDSPHRSTPPQEEETGSEDTSAGAADYLFGSAITKNNKEQLVADLQGLSVNDGMQRLRAMPLSLTDKIELRQLAFSATGQSSLINRNIACYVGLNTCLSKTSRRCLLSSLSVLTSLHLWHSPMKRLSGRFGTAVLSYFLFLRTLLFFNIFLFVVSGLFLILPQAVYPPYHHRESHTLTGLEFLAGTGYFSQSLMFYGYYSDTIKPCGTAELKPSSSADTAPCNTEGLQMSYSIPTAYFFTIIFTLFITCISLVYSVSRSLGRHFHALKSNGYLAILVFSSWDFRVTKKTSVIFQSEKISIQLKEQLSEMICGEERKSCMQRLCCLITHAMAWAMCLTSISLTAMGVHHLSEATIKEDLKETGLLLLSAAVATINLSLPGLFNLCVHLEKYDSPVACVYVSIFRNLLLKVSVVGVLCYRWMRRIAVEPCWESFVGQELYRLLLMDFIFVVLHTVLGEFLWRLLSQKIWKRNVMPTFNIAENVLDLIYGQTLTWLGVLVAPLLPAVQLIKLFVLFYIKKTSLMLNCQVPKKPWRATQMTTLFISLLCFPSFFGAAMSISYAIVTNLSTVFEIGQLWAQQLEKANPNLSWLSWTYNFLVENPLFIFLCSGVLLMVIYFHTEVVDGQRKAIGLLEKQLENEGKDKMFLITKLQRICEHNSVVSPS